jgi:hypothetical protein
LYRFALAESVLEAPDYSVMMTKDDRDGKTCCEPTTDKGTKALEGSVKV